MKFIELSNEAISVIKNGDTEGIMAVSSKIAQYLMEVYGELQTVDLSIDELKAFESCAMTLEYSVLHFGKEQRYNFILLELIGNDERFAQLKQRIRLIDLPNQVSNIERDWKNYLERALQDMEVLKGIGSFMHNESTSELFYKRAGVKVISDFQRMLLQINSQETFIPYLYKLLIENEVVGRFLVPEILSMTTGANSVDLSEDILA
jgi:hypothetical protein